MKQLIYVLPLALCPATAQVADAKAACMAALDSMKNTQSEDMGPVVTAVLDATGGKKHQMLGILWLCSGRPDKY